MLELCDIYSARKGCPCTQETGTFRRMVISRMVKSSAWFLSPLFIAVALCCEMLRGQNTLRGHRAVGLERPHELLWARKRAQKCRLGPIPCFVRAQFDRRARRNFFYFGLLQNPTVNRKVNDTVNCVFHAPFTLGRRVRADD